MKLVFVHGSGGTGRVWRYQSEHFAGSLAVTLPGRPDGEPRGSMEEVARWLHGELRREEGAPFVLVGHSLGGGVVLQYALDHPDEVAGLVFIGSGARLRVNPATLDALEKRPEVFRKIIDDFFAKARPEFAEELIELSTAVGPAVFLADLRVCDRFDVIERLGEVEVPVLAIVGSEDALTPPKYSTFLEERMPNASAKYSIPW